MTKTGIKKMLKALAKTSRQDWEALGSSVFAGEATLSTAHTAYELVDGVCTAVRNAGTKSGGGIVGMRLVGWLTWDGDRLVITQAYTPAAGAVLWKPGFGGGTIALTSATTEWRRPMPTAPSTRPIPPPPESTVQRKGPQLGVRRPDMDSLTRIHTTK